MSKAKKTAYAIGVGAAVAAGLALGATASTSWASHEPDPVPVAAVNSEAPTGAYGMTDPSGESSAWEVPEDGAPTTADSGADQDAALKAALVAVAKAGQPIPPVVVTNGPRTSNKVALTFDADLSDYTAGRINAGALPEQYNEPIINYLEQTGTPATIFVTGLWAQRYSGAMQRMAGNPLFEFGNHTWSHEAWTANCYKLPFITDPAAKRAQVNNTNDVIASYTGKAPRFFRNPGLCHSEEDVALVADMHLVPVDRDVTASDAFAKNGYVVAQNLARQVQPGSIIVLHLNGAPNAPTTADIVANLVPMLKQAGLQPVTLSELLG